MTGFDAFAILVVLGSCGMGWMRGATRELVALHGGELRLVPGDGSGAVFELRLPA